MCQQNRWPLFPTVAKSRFAFLPKIAIAARQCNPGYRRPMRTPEIRVNQSQPRRIRRQWQSRYRNAGYVMPNPQNKLSFDQCQFARRKYDRRDLFRARRIAGEWTAPGISYSDNECHSMFITHTQGKWRGSKSLPAWANNNEMCREVLVRFMEKRAYIGDPKNRRKRLPGTYAERLARAEQILATNRRLLISQINRLCAEYVRLKQTSRLDRKRQRDLERLIQSTDTQLCMATHTQAIVIGVIFYYLRLGLTSTEVAERLHLKPIHVRQLAYNLRAIGAALYPQDALAP